MITKNQTEDKIIFDYDEKQKIEEILKKLKNPIK